MKSLRNITKKEETEYMRRMRDMNLSRALVNQNENWMSEKLGSGWTRQAIRGYRIFDFWSAELGVAVEVDGVEHDREYDNYRDEYNFRRSGVLVLRVRNRNEVDAENVLTVISKLGSLAERKVEIGIAADTKKGRRILSDQPYWKDRHMFVEYLEKHDHKPYWREL